MSSALILYHTVIILSFLLNEKMKFYAVTQLLLNSETGVADLADKTAGAGISRARHLIPQDHLAGPVSTIRKLVLIANI
jgi:hypothetical protein